jgi:hypothetical protein
LAGGVVQAANVRATSVSETGRLRRVDNIRNNMGTICGY